MIKMVILMNKRMKQIITSIICFIIYFNNDKIARILLHFIKTNNKMLLSILTNTIIILIFVFIYKKELKNEFSLYKKNFKKFMDIGLELWLIGLGIMVFSNLAIAIFTSAGGAHNEQVVQELIKSYPFLMLIEAGFIAPICEEFVFRKCFKNIFSNPRIFIVVSSLLFGLLHVLNATSTSQLLYIIPYSSLGVMLALMYQKTDSIYTSISIHMIHNILLTILSII